MSLNIEARSLITPEDLAQMWVNKAERTTTSKRIRLFENNKTVMNQLSKENLNVAFEKCKSILEIFKANFKDIKNNEDTEKFIEFVEWVGGHTDPKGKGANENLNDLFQTILKIKAEWEDSSLTFESLQFTNFPPDKQLASPYNQLASYEPRYLKRSLTKEYKKIESYDEKENYEGIELCKKLKKIHSGNKQEAKIYNLFCHETLDVFGNQSHDIFKIVDEIQSKIKDRIKDIKNTGQAYPQIKYLHQMINSHLEITDLLSIREVSKRHLECQHISRMIIKTILRLEKNKFKELNLSIDELITSLDKHCDKLKKLDLEDYQVDKDIIEKISSKFTNLKVLSLKKCEINHKVLKALMLPKLEELNIGYCIDISDISFLMANCPNLKKIKLPHCFRIPSNQINACLLKNIVVSKGDKLIFD